MDVDVPGASQGYAEPINNSFQGTHKLATQIHHKPPSMNLNLFELDDCRLISDV